MSLIKKIKLKYILTIIITNIIFFLVLSLSYIIPTQSIRDNISDSLSVLKKEGEYYKPFFGNNSDLAKSYTLDNFTDAVILNICYDLEGENLNIFERASTNSRYRSKGSVIGNLESVAKNEKNANSTYERYWFGTVAILRPLLALFNYQTIRYLNYLLVFTLFMIAFYLISKNNSFKIAMAFAISFLFMGLPIIPMSLQYMPVCVITLSVVIILNILYKKAYFKKVLPYIFLLTGSITAFMDLLSYPLLTFGIPIIILLLLNNEDNKNFKDYFTIFVKMAALWSLGYLMTFFIKWVIASIILNKNVIENAWKQFIHRTDITSWKESKFTAIANNFSLYFNIIVLSFIAIFYLYYIIKIIKALKNKNRIIKRENLKLVLVIAIVALMPYLWYLVFNNHSSVHSWMTYKIQAITMMGIIIIPMLLFNEKRINII